jgi:hypothetical protein
MSNKNPDLSSQNDPCRKPDRIGKIRDCHPIHQYRCNKPDTDENRRQIKTQSFCGFDMTKEERIKWCDPEDLDDDGDVKGMKLHKEARRRGYANPMEMYHKEKKAEENRKEREQNKQLDELKQENAELKAKLDLVMAKLGM